MSDDFELEMQVDNPLTEEERAEFAECKAIVNRNLPAFWETGMALLKIRNKRLYRETHTSFRQFCEDEWAISEGHAHHLCDTSEVVQNLSSGLVQDESNPNFRQAKVLARLKDPSQQRLAWKLALEKHRESSSSRKITARDVDEVVRIYFEKRLTEAEEAANQRLRDIEERVDQRLSQERIKWAAEKEGEEAIRRARDAQEQAEKHAREVEQRAEQLYRERQEAERQRRDAERRAEELLKERDEIQMNRYMRFRKLIEAVQCIAEFQKVTLSYWCLNSWMASVALLLILARKAQQTKPQS